MIRGAPSDFYTRNQFRLEIDGVVYAGFRDISEIGGELDAVEHREGGTNYPFSKPGNETYPEVTCTQGFANITDELYSWWDQARQGGKGRSAPRSLIVRTAHMIQMDIDGTDKYQWTLYECWPRVFKGGPWDKGASEVTIRTLILRFAYFDQKSLVTV